MNPNAAFESSDGADRPNSRHSSLAIEDSAHETILRLSRRSSAILLLLLSLGLWGALWALGASLAALGRG